MRYDDDGNMIPPTDREVMRAGRKWVIIGFLALLLIPMIAWGASVMLSGPRGRGEQIKQVNKAENRTYSQEMFHQILADIRAYDQQIGIQQEALNAHPQQDIERNRLSQVVAGVRSQCLSTVEQYNAEARKISREKFRDSDLPAEVDTFDPNYDCKENS